MPNTTKSDLAAELGITRARVSQLCKSGLPILADGTIDRTQALNWLAQNKAHFGVRGETAASRAAQLLRADKEGSSQPPKQLEAGSDYGEGIRYDLDHWETERHAMAPENAKETVEEIAAAHKVSVATVLDWIRAGLPCVRTGNWNTGEGFILHFHWTWSWLQSTATTLHFNGEHALLQRLRLNPYIEVGYNHDAHS